MLASSVERSGHSAGRFPGAEMRACAGAPTSLGSTHQWPPGSMGRDLIPAPESVPECIHAGCDADDTADLSGSLELS